MNSEDMKKAVLIAAIMLAAALKASAGKPVRDYPGFTYGIEGSFILTAMSCTHSNYIADDGYRVDDRRSAGSPVCNGELLLNAGYNISRHMNLALYAGISGIGREETVLPISLRYTVFYGKDPLESRWFSFIGAGAGLGIRTGSRALTGGSTGRFSPLANIGTGYRISLSRSAKLDFLLSFRGIFMHPAVMETVDGKQEAVPAGRLRRSEAFYGAVAFGIGLNF